MVIAAYGTIGHCMADIEMLTTLIFASFPQKCTFPLSMLASCGGGGGGGGVGADVDWELSFNSPQASYQSLAR